MFLIITNIELFQDMNLHRPINYEAIKPLAPFSHSST
jgi:hypothetical protein